MAGVFQRIPQVPSSESHLKSALRKANRLQGNKKIKGKLQHARNLSARKLDALTKEIAVPLGAIIKGFPACSRMHPFEQALLDLTIGSGIYEKRLQQLDNLRKSCLQVRLLKNEAFPMQWSYVFLLGKEFFIKFNFTSPSFSSPLQPGGHFQSCFCHRGAAQSSSTSMQEKVSRKI